MDCKAHIVKMSAVPKLTYWLNEIPSNIQARMPCRYKITLKYIWTGKGTRRAKIIWKKKNKVGGKSTQYQDMI